MPGGAQSVPSLRQTRRATSSSAALASRAATGCSSSARQVGLERRRAAGDDRLALGLDAGQQLVHRRDEGLDAVAQQLVGDVVDVDARRAQRVEVRRGVERGGRAAHLGLGGRGLQGRQRHRVHRVGPDEAVDVQRLRVRRVLDAGGGPERALDGAAGLAQRGELLPAVDALERLVGGARVGEARLALQLVVAERGQPLVDLRVDAGDEERRDGVAVERAAVGVAPGHRADVRAHDVLVGRDGEEERHVDVHALVQGLLDRRDPLRRGGDLDHEVRAVDEVPVHAGLLERPVGVVRQARRDLERDVAVEPARLLVDRPQRVGRELDVADGEAAVDLPRGEALLRRGAHVLVVVGGAEDGLLEDRRVRGDAAQRVLVDHPGELAALDHAAADLIQPDAGAGRGQRGEPLVHALRLLDHGAGALGDLLAGDPEVLVHDLRGRRRAEGLHRDHVAMVAHPAVPADRARRLHGDPGLHGRRQDLVAVAAVLLGEAVHARHGDQPYPDAVGLEQLARVVGQVDLGARAHEDHLRLAAVGLVQDVGAALDRVVGHRRRVPHREALAGERERGRPVRLAQRVAPGERGLVEARGPHHVEVGRRPQRHELLDRLVGRAVLPHADRVVREDERRRDPHDRRQADRALHVVAEDQEAGAEGAEPGQRQPVDHGAHRVLADAEVEVAPAVLAGLDAPAAVDERERGGRQVGRAADQLGNLGRRPLDDLLGGLAGGDHAGVRALLRDVGPEAGRQRVAELTLELPGLGLEVLAVGLELLLPALLLLAAAVDGLAEVGERLVGDEERLEARVAVDLLGEPDLLLAERRAVRAVRVLLVRRAGRDVRAHDDQARAVRDLLRRGHRGVELVEADVLVQVLDVPAVGLVAGADVLGEGELRVALDRDVVVVVEADQAAEAEVARERGGLAGDALLQVAVRGDEVRVGVDRRVVALVEAGGEHALAERHADRGGDALAERAGRGLDARDVAVLRMARARRVDLAELLDLVERDVVAGQVQDAVEQHRGVTAGEDEAVAARPVGILRVVLHHPRVEQVGDRGQRHRRPGVAGVRLLDGVHRQGADGVHAQLVQRLLVGTHRHGGSFSRVRLLVFRCEPTEARELSDVRLVSRRGGREHHLMRALLAALVLALPGTAAAAQPARPFGSHPQPLAAGAQQPRVSRAALDRATAAAYDAWAARYLEPGCAPGELRVRAAPGAPAHVVSEGQGYGMVIVALMAGHDPAARVRFDGLARYLLAHPSRGDPRLTAWAQDARCRDVRGADSAADGDLDAAFGLLLADAQWGSDGAVGYRSAALRMLGGIAAEDLHPRTDLPTLGDWTSPAEPRYWRATRPSDWMPDHLRAFAAATGDARWERSRAASLRLARRVAGRRTGLLPDFVVRSRPARAGFLEGPDDGRFSWNACRTPWRLGTEAALYGGGRARAAVRAVSRWARRETGGRVARVRAGYTLRGRPLTRDRSLAFTAPLAVAAMSDPGGRGWLDRLWAHLVAAPPEGYYADSIRLQSMLVVSGNWWVP